MATSNEVKLLKSIAVDARIPTMLIGSPGTSKTATVRSLAKEIGYDLEILIGSQMDVTELSGLPKEGIVGDDVEGNAIHGTVNLPMRWQQVVRQRGKVVLFLDEFSNVPPSVKAGFLTMIQDRVFPNGDKMPDETVIIGAMNPPEESADPFEMDEPTANRFFHMAWNPSVDEWLEGMPSGWGKEDMSENEAKWRGLIVRFITDNPGFLHMQNNSHSHDEFASSRGASDAEVAKMAWASRRSWDNLSVALGALDDNGYSSVYLQDRTAEGLVGFSASHNFREWLRKNGNINPKKVLEDPDAFNWEAISIDDLNMVIRSVLDDFTKDKAEDIIYLFDVMGDESKADRANIAGPYVSDLIKNISKIRDSELKKKLNKDMQGMLQRYKAVGNHSY